MKNKQAVEFLTELNSAGIKYQIENGLFILNRQSKVSDSLIIRMWDIPNSDLIKAASELK